MRIRGYEGYLLRRFNANELSHELVERNDRGWASRPYRNADGLQVAILTHPGIANWTVPETDPTDIVRLALH